MDVFRGRDDGVAVELKLFTGDVCIIFVTRSVDPPHVLGAFIAN